MVDFCIRLAGVPFRVEAAYETTKKFCREYLTEEAPLFTVTLTKEHIDMVRERHRPSASAEGRRLGRRSDNYWETLALCFEAMDRLVDFGVLLMHGSVLAAEGKAYLFTAKSGTGKTTHSRLWLQCFPECHILNGDEPLLRFEGGQVYACGSPWRGKERYGINETLPLAAICLLERDSVNRIREVSLADSLETLLRQCHIPGGDDHFLSVLRLMQNFSGTKFYRLGCNMEEEAALVSYSAMVKR